MSRVLGVALIALAWAAVGCAKPEVSFGDSGGGGVDTSGDGGTTGDDQAAIVDAEASCSGSLEISAEIEGDVASGVHYANIWSTDGDPFLHEEHTLDLVGDALERTLSMGGGYDQDVSSALSCSQALTYAVRLRGADGEIADCVAWGHDPVSALRSTGLASEFETFEDCRTLSD